MNAQEARIRFPWLVFNEKVKVNSVFIRDSTGVSDSVVLLFGGNVSNGGLVSLYDFLVFNFKSVCSCNFVIFIGWPHENAGWVFGIFYET